MFMLYHAQCKMWKEVHLEMFHLQIHLHIEFTEAFHSAHFVLFIFTFILPHSSVSFFIADVSLESDVEEKGG
jgi:hypothetical protein